MKDKVSFTEFREDFNSVVNFCYKILERLALNEEIPDEYYNEGIYDADEEGIMLICTEEGDDTPFFVKVIYPASKICSEAGLDESYDKTLEWLRSRHEEGNGEWE